MAIHVPINQSTDLADVNLYDIDAVLKGLIRLHGGAWGEDLLMRFGEFVGSSEAIELAVLSNTNLPALHTRTRFGQRIDEVKYDRAYHELMAASIAHGAHSLSWRDSREGAHLVRAALLFLAFQNEAGHCCPISMTHAAIAALRKQPDIAQRWERLITSNSYDRRSIPAEQKMGLTVGMSMTESQGGSDVRANLTTAQPIDQAGAGNLYTLHGWKWFCSAPMSDFFLITAKASKGLSCFLVPRWTPDGKRNNFFILGLKDKLGNRCNASAEIQLDGALGWLIGEEGRGIPTIIEMVNHTRLDCALSSAALMRQAVLQAMHHCRYRSAFGKRLIDQPLMNNVLADLSLESEAALQLAMRVARSYDRAASDEGEALFKRIASAVAKYWICKRAPVVVADALECLGGNGYVEESPMPRLFRESPLL